MRRLLQAGVHFGHQTRYWSPSMAPYIYGRRNKIHIINLEKTLPMLDEALSFLGTVASKGGTVLFVGTKRQAGKQVREAATACGSPFVDHRWLGGMLTNFKTVRNSITRLKELEEFMKSADRAKMSKKEILSLDRERAKLDRTLSGIKELEGPPDALFVIDVQYEKIAVREATKLGIPVVAVVDTNCSPDNIEYIIPGNDDSGKAIGLYLEAVSQAISEARAAKQLEAPLAEGDEFVDVEEAGKVMDLSGVLDSDSTGQDAESSEAEEPVEQDQPDQAPPKQVIRKKIVRRKSAEGGGKSSKEVPADPEAAQAPSPDKVDGIVAEVAAGSRSQAGAIRYMHEAGMDHHDIAGRLDVDYQHVRTVLLESASMLTRPVEEEAESPADEDPFA